MTFHCSQTDFSLTECLSDRSSLNEWLTGYTLRKIWEIWRNYNTKPKSFFDVNVIFVQLKHLYSLHHSPKFSNFLNISFSHPLIFPFFLASAVSTGCHPVATCRSSSAIHLPLPISPHSTPLFTFLHSLNFFQTPSSTFTFHHFLPHLILEIIKDSGGLEQEGARRRRGDHLHLTFSPKHYSKFSSTI